MKNELCKPFMYEEIEWRLQSTFKDGNTTKGIAIPYLKRIAIQNRLDEVFGVLGWKVQFKEWHTTVEKNGDSEVMLPSQLCGISVYNENTGEWITKWDGASNTSYEGIKGGISDSFKRAATMFGIGRYLANLETQFVNCELRGAKKTPYISKQDISVNLKNNYNKEIARLFPSQLDNFTPEPPTPPTKKNTNHISSNSQQPFNRNNLANNIAPQEIIEEITKLAEERNISLQYLAAHYKVANIYQLTIDNANNAISKLYATPIKKVANG